MSEAGGRVCEVVGTLKDVGDGCPGCVYLSKWPVWLHWKECVSSIERSFVDVLIYLPISPTSTPAPAPAPALTSHPNAPVTAPLASCVVSNTASPREEANIKPDFPARIDLTESRYDLTGMEGKQKAPLRVRLDDKGMTGVVVASQV